LSSFKQKVAIVTGGGAGIGEAICQEMARQGAQVVVADVNQESAQEVASAITGKGGSARAVKVDMSNEADVRRLVDDTTSIEGRLDYMFNNAGIAIGGDARDLSTDQWRRVLDVDMFGVLYGTLAAYRVMVGQGFGHIVNTSSATGLSPQPGNAPYCMSKHAVVGLSLSLRFEGADLGVKVSVICPGYVRTSIYRNMELANISRERFAAQLSKRKEMEASQAAKVILDGVERNQSIIIFPAWVRWAWRLYRFSPGLLDRAWLNGIREFRKYRLNAETHPA